MAHFTSEELADIEYEKAQQMALGIGSGGYHIGGSFSCIEILAVLYGGYLEPTLISILHSIVPKKPIMPGAFMMETMQQTR